MCYRCGGCRRLGHYETPKASFLPWTLPFSGPRASGRAIAGQLVAARLLSTTERLQLVGRREGKSGSLLHGLMSDLTDAHAEQVPYIDVALSPEEIVADLWVVSVGATIPPHLDRNNPTRADLAAANAPVLRAAAEALARYGQGTEIVIVVTNPVELGVAYFAEAIGRERVIGIGAYSDTLRFRREIAADIGVRRQRVSGFMLGEHGDGQVPVWSSVQIHGMAAPERDAAVAGLRQGIAAEDFAAVVAPERHEINLMLQTGRVAEAFARVDTLPPDVRVIVKPYITHFSGSKTVLATASVTVDLLSTLYDGREVLVAGQTMLEPSDFYDLEGPLGVPVVVGAGGISRVVEIPLADTEYGQLAAVSQRLHAQVKPWMHAAV